ncbi:MAG: AAA family ATPase, partial [Chloroflexota bacterium]|nr:AAA family ATPase [Chloroflexota bacterium]
MSSDPLKKLTIAHLRGSVASFELPFERGRKLTVIYGENGTGKSTICDALELLSKGRIGSLDNRGLGKTNKYWTTVSKKPTDVSVALETARGSCRATIVKNDVVIQPSEARPQVEVLRRGQILGLVEALPSERYTTISRFIDVSGIEKSENTLRKLITDLNRSRDIAVARILENLGAIEQFWEADGKPGSDALAWARAESLRDPDSADPELTAIQALQHAYSRLSEHPTRLAQVEHAFQRARDAVAAAQQAANLYLETMAQDAGEVVAVLQAAHTYLSKHPASDVCVVCGSAAAAQGLAVRIDQRLQDFAAFQALQATQRSANIEQQRAEQQRSAVREQAQRDAIAFDALRAQFDWSPDIALPATTVPQDVDLLVSWLATTAGLPENWRLAEAARPDRRQFFVALRGALSTFTENMQGQQELDVLLPNLQRALVIVEGERKAFTDHILDKIASDVGRMYEAVHPGEGLNQIKL